jgi:hypothetical protein
MSGGINALNDSLMKLSVVHSQSYGEGNNAGIHDPS